MRHLVRMGSQRRTPIQDNRCVFRRGFFLALELRFLRTGGGLFFSTRFFLGRGLANTSMSLAFKMESLPRFIAAIIRSRMNLALATTPSKTGRLADSHPQKSGYNQGGGELGAVEKLIN
jgi:hypothetical protein